MSNIWGPGLHLDRRLHWKNHYVLSTNNLNYNKGKCIGHSVVSHNCRLKINCYCTMQYSNLYRPMYSTMGYVQLDIEIFQRFQNKILRIIVDGAWYVTNDILHQDLNVPHVKDEIRRHKPEICWHEHPNILTKNLIRFHRRLKRKLPQDLCTWTVQFYRIYANGHILCKTL